MPSPVALSGLIPFLKPYRWPLVWAGVFLLLAAAATLAFPWALRHLIDDGLSSAQAASDVGAGFVRLFLVSVALAVFSSLRYYTVSWLEIGRAHV